MVAAYLLGPRAYGAFAALMAALLVISVLQLGLQATAARRIAADPDHVQQIERIILRRHLPGGARCSGLVLVALSPLLDALLRLDSLLTAALVGVTAVPLTVMGGQAGILQGERRWTALSVVYVAAGVPRLVIGLLLMLVSTDRDQRHARRHPGGLRPGRDRLVGPAATAAGGRAGRAAPAPAGDPRDRCTTPGAVRVLRALATSTSSSPATC